MSFHSANSERLRDQLNSLRSTAKTSFRKSALGLFCLGLMCLLSSTMPGATRITSACTGAGFTSVANLSKVLIVTAHNAASATDIHNKFLTIRNTNNINKPIIFSDDGKNNAGETQCNPATMLICLNQAIADGCSFEHLDSCNTGTPANPTSLTTMEEGMPDANPPLAPRPIPTAFNSWPQNSRTCLQNLSTQGQNYPLAYPGYLTVCDEKLYWNDSTLGTREIRLVGFSDFGAVAAGPSIFTDLTAYLGILADHHINFTRIFVVDPWSNAYSPIYPFYKSGQYDISQKNQDYFNRLQNFVTYAAQRGIVVQIALFDQCGFKSDVWGYNPYNLNNNINSPYFSYGNPYPKGVLPNVSTFLSASSDANVGNFHSSFISWVLAAVGSNGNVILEIMNEPASDSNITNFHSWVASKIIPAGSLLPVTSFTATGLLNKVKLNWSNPTYSSFTGTMIRVSTSGYPADPYDGDLVVDKSNAAGTSDTFTHTGLITGFTYYYSAFAHDCHDNYTARKTASATPWGSSPAPSQAPDSKQ